MKAGVCNYLYGRNVGKTGKFCAGGKVDACQVGRREGGYEGDYEGYKEAMKEGRRL